MQSVRYVRFNGSAGVAVQDAVASEQKQVHYEDSAVLILQVPTNADTLGKMFDLKPLSKYVGVACT
jgi:hypothetical protein